MTGTRAPLRRLRLGRIRADLGREVRHELGVGTDDTEGSRAAGCAQRRGPTGQQLVEEGCVVSQERAERARQVILVEDRRDRADGFARTAVDALRRVMYSDRSPS